jgi:dGTPase
MYRHARVMRVMGDAEAIVTDLFAHYRDYPQTLPAEWLPAAGVEGEGDSARLRRICNFIAGMTDRFALTEHQRLFDSSPELR